MPMIVKNGESSFFSCNLIHGPGNNFTSKNRISIDFKIIRKKDYKIDKKPHISSNKPYFIDFDELN